MKPLEILHWLRSAETRPVVVFKIPVVTYIFCFAFMSGSCHLDRLLNVEIGVECQIFVIVIFLTAAELTIWGTFKVL